LLIGENVCASLTLVVVVFVIVREVERCWKDDEGGSGDSQSTPSGFVNFSKWFCIVLLFVCGLL
ncbi:MAG: hypothetical protein LBF54_02755, partial [Holosporaceae bacterium]|nr:hypothetical protein [Holosporaceae bacterium]